MASEEIWIETKTNASQLSMSEYALHSLTAI